MDDLDDYEFAGTLDVTPYIPEDWEEKSDDWKDGYVTALVQLACNGILPMDEDTRH